MSFKNPDKLKKKKNIKPPDFSSKTGSKRLSTNRTSKKGNEKSGRS